MKDRCVYQIAFEGIECCVMTGCPDKLCIMMGKGCEKFCYPSKILDELAVVIYKAKKCSSLFSIFRGFHQLNSCIMEASAFIPVLPRTWPKY